MGRQKNFGTDHAALSGVVVIFSVVIAVKPLPGPVSGGGNGALPGASFNLIDGKMIQCDSQSPSFSLAGGWLCRSINRRTMF